MQKHLLLSATCILFLCAATTAQIVKASQHDELAAKKKGTLSTSQSSGGGKGGACWDSAYSSSEFLCIDSNITLSVNYIFFGHFVSDPVTIKWYSADSTFLDSTVFDPYLDDTAEAHIIVNKPNIYRFDLTVPNSFTNDSTGEVINGTAYCHAVFDVTSNIPINIPQQTQLCEGSSVTLKAPNENFSSYQWFNNNQLISGEESDSINVLTTGNYHVQITDSNKCILNSDIVNVTNYQPPSNLDITGDSCTNGTISLATTTDDEDGLSPQSITWYINNKTAKTFNNEGKIIAGGNDAGNNLNQLNAPFGIFLDSLKNLYIADYNNNRIMKWAPQASFGETVLNNINQFGGSPTDVVLNLNKYTVTTTRNVLQFLSVMPDTILNKNAWGISIDFNHNLYLANDAEDNIHGGKIYYIDSNKIVAGDGDIGSDSSNLNYPNGIYIDSSHTLYITDNLTDSLNNFYARIVRWDSGATTGKLLAGDNGYGNAPNQIWFAADVTFDKLGNMYVSDAINNRVQLWKPGADHGITIASGFTPWGIAVDDSLNLYVADQTNNAVRKFPSLLYNSIIADSPGIYKAVVTYPGGCTVTSNEFVVKECGVLATKLLNLTAHLQNKNAELSWQTASEINTSYFNIQRSTDGVNFKTIGKIYASGNNTLHSYTYEDKNVTDLKTTKLYYRISKVNNDRTSVESNTVLINITKAGWSLTVNPNPVQNKLKLQLNNIYGTTNIAIINMAGKKLITQQINASGNNEVNFNTSALSAGIYFIEIMNNAKKEHLKFVKQ